MRSACSSASPATSPILERGADQVRGAFPADLQRCNINLVGGDPYSGACSLNQFHAWRPFPGGRNLVPSFDGLYHIGASTHPGPGLGGLSGYLAAADIA